VQRAILSDLDLGKFSSLQTVPLSEPHGSEAVSQCLSGSRHLHTKPERLGLPFLMSWDLQLLLHPEMGRWDHSLTSVQQQHCKEGLQSHHCMASSQKTPLAVEGLQPPTRLLGAERVHPPEPPTLLCCHCDRSSRAHYWEQERPLKK